MERIYGLSTDKERIRIDFFAVWYLATTCNEMKRSVIKWGREKWGVVVKLSDAAVISFEG